MSYVTSFERLSREEGLQQGREEGHGRRLFCWLPEGS